MTTSVQSTTLYSAGRLQSSYCPKSCYQRAQECENVLISNFGAVRHLLVLMILTILWPPSATGVKNRGQISHFFTLCEIR